jgi:hypothetical protein
MDAPFKTYEDVARHLLKEVATELDLETVESGQALVGFRSGATWTIDAKGVRTADGGFVIIECRRYTTSRLKQEHVGALAYRIHDTGAAGGILVSPMGLQEGAGKVASAEGIVDVRLDEGATTSDYILRFLGSVRIGTSVAFGAKAGVSCDAEVLRKPRGDAG